MQSTAAKLLVLLLTCSILYRFTVVCVYHFRRYAMSLLFARFSGKYRGVFANDRSRDPSDILLVVGTIPLFNV